MVGAWTIIKFAASVLTDDAPCLIRARQNNTAKPLYKNIFLFTKKEFNEHRIYDGVICVIKIRDDVDVDHFAMFAVVGGGVFIGSFSELQADEPKIVRNLVQSREATGRQRPQQEADAQPSHRRLRHGSRDGSAQRTPRHGNLSVSWYRDNPLIIRVSGGRPRGCRG